MLSSVYSVFVSNKISFGDAWNSIMLWDHKLMFHDHENNPVFSSAIFNYSWRASHDILLSGIGACGTNEPNWKLI